jgi:hypothetical protein
MRQFQNGAFAKRSPGLLMGREEKASAEHPFAADHLQCTVSLGKERKIKEKQTFHLVHFI